MDTATFDALLALYADMPPSAHKARLGQILQRRTAAPRAVNVAILLQAVGIGAIG
jgi:hypothetical protein